MRGPTILLFAAEFLLVFGGGALGQGSGGPALTVPDASKPASSTPTTAADPAAKPQFPAKLNKELFATNDYRGRKAPEIKAEGWLTPAGKPAAPDRTGKVTLVDFWATWCPPCRALIPELNAWQKEFKDDLVVIGISSEPAETVKNFMGKVTTEYAMGFDTRNNDMTKNAIGVRGIPHVLVIDSTGIVRWQGFPQSNEEKLTTDLIRQIVVADKAQRGAKPDEKKPEPVKPEPMKAEKPVEKKSEAK